MAEILALGLEFFGGGANALAEVRQAIAEAMRVEVGQAGGFESLLENGPDSRRATAVPAVQADTFEMAAWPHGDAGHGKQRVRRAV